MLEGPEFASNWPAVRGVLEWISSDANREKLSKALPDESRHPRIVIDGWRCNLEERTFTIAVTTKIQIVDLHGRFVRGSDGEWKAILTSFDIGCLE
jgi:hypothetical protein